MKVDYSIAEIWEQMFSEEVRSVKDFIIMRLQNLMKKQQKMCGMLNIFLVV